MQRGAGICRVNRGHRERLQELFIAFSVEFGPGWKAEDLPRNASCLGPTTSLFVDTRIRSTVLGPFSVGDLFLLE